MYKFLLSWRYLRTRYIALASIISVTLGVATLIVVNSVMAGFSYEMHKRLHGILSDVVFESPGLEAIEDPEWHMAEIEKELGDDVEGMTPTVRVPAMISFRFRGRWIKQQVMVIGIDDKTYAKVSDFSQYLMHPDNKRQLNFDLKENGYDERIPESGWVWRRERVSYERQYLPRAAAGKQAGPDDETATAADLDLPFHQDEFGPAWEQGRRGDILHSAAAEGDAVIAGEDPFAGHKHEPAVQPFDEMSEQFTGVVLGISLASVRHRHPETGEVEDVFLCRPGDDVQLMLPSDAMPPQPVTLNCTIVDLYESKMSEYDSSFVFMPLSKLQELRGMVDPLTGKRSVSAIQIKLKEGVDPSEARDRLQARFPADRYPYRVQTWRDMQGPLLAAVKLETAILNILLFLIIAVAGFGILATFFMIVVEKTRDIGILKSLGAPSRGVMSIFLSYGLSLGIVGSGVGTALGVLFVVYINDIAALQERITGQEVFDPTVYYFQEIPTILDPITICWVAAGAVLIAVLASVLPAIRAARLHPVEALRYE